MTACSSKLQSICFKDESAFAENVSTMTSAQILPLTDAMVDVSKLGPAYVDPGRVTQYLHERDAMISGPFSNTEFSVSFQMTGHGSTTAGAITATAMENFLGWMLGGGPTLTGDGTTIGGVSTVSSLATTSSGGLAPGGFVWVGVKGDGRGDGQPSIIDTCVTTTSVLECALPAAPTTALPDVVYTGANVYTLETSCSTGTSKRFRIGTADTAWVPHGCFPKSITWQGGNAGEILKVTAGIGCAWVEPVSTTFPDIVSTAAPTTNAVPTAGGGCFLQVYNTVTRQIVTARSFSLTYAMGVVPVLGYNGISTQQVVVGASRVPGEISLSIIVDAEGDSATPTWWTAGGTNSIYHCLMSYTVGDGSRVACYLPRLRWSGNKPTQQDHEGLNRVQLDFVAGTDTAETASALTLSAMRWGIG